MQVGQSGTRQTTVFIPAGTTATEVLPNGTTQPITSAHLRATEFTVGANGPQAMPAALPATSAYTYAVDLSLDEAQSAGATTVQFSQPVPVYVNNYLGIPIGTNVPAGWYDPTVGAWKGSTDGVVLKFLRIDANGDAEVDLTGSGTPATAAQLSAYGITTAELAQIAKTFTSGQSFWRVLVPHFTYWDFNYGYNPQAGYLLPPSPQPNPPPASKLRVTPHNHVCTGCQIDAENQRV
ncbi:YD repeat-containing protein, partial [mine drainage metagenome]